MNLLEKVRELPREEKWEIYHTLEAELEGDCPDWVRVELARRDKLIEDGEDKFVDWEEAKVRLAAKFK